MRSLRRQDGAAMLALVAVLVMAVLAGIMSLVHSALSQPATNRSHNARVLQQAKDALIGYVVKEAVDLTNSTPGQLPCPEAPGDAGTSLEGRTGSCSAPTTIGRLPWRTLGLDKLVDAASEPLWYVVSPTWAGSGLTKINSGTPGDLSVDGVTDVVAVIIAPGAALTTSPTSAQQTAPYSCEAKAQFRNDRSHVPGGGNPDPANYLECANATAYPDLRLGSSIVDNDTNPVLNDQLVYITAKDILNAIQGPVAERMQRTVAPLLSDFSTSWIGNGTIHPVAASTPLTRFMPYAFPFAAPESNPAAQTHCGSAATPVREGLLPIAGMALAGACGSPWGSFSWAGSIGNTTCTADGAGAVTCQFDYYTLRTIPLININLFDLLSLSSPATIDVTIRAAAPYAASSFRKSLAATDFTVTPTANLSLATFTQQPNATNGGVDLALQLRIANASLCTDTSAAINVVCSTLTDFGSVCMPILNNAFVCGLLSGLFSELLTSPHSITVKFPALSNPMVMSGSTPVSLLSPAATDPHYWFFNNEWYRYSYYSLSGNASAAATGGELTVNGFPADFGSATDKRFVLALMGPPITGQSRGPVAGIAQYLEGANSQPSATPRVFSYHVFAAPGNDRIAACPYSTGGTPICN